MEGKKTSKPTCGISSSPGCTSSPKPSMRAQWFPLCSPNTRYKVDSAEIPTKNQRKLEPNKIPLPSSEVLQKERIRFNFIPPSCMVSHKISFSGFSTCNRLRTETITGWLTFLNIVIRQSASIVELLAGENETLLVRGNSCKQLCQRNQVLKP